MWFFEVSGGKVRFLDGGDVEWGLNCEEIGKEFKWDEVGEDNKR